MFCYLWMFVILFYFATVSLYKQLYFNTYKLLCFYSRYKKLNCAKKVTMTQQFYYLTFLHNIETSNVYI